jgi:hypothetical protein
MQTILVVNGPNLDILGVRQPEIYGPATLKDVEDELRAEIASLKDQLLRSLAEVENVRRRVEREKQDTTKFAVANFAKAVLPVADNLERALSAASPEARGKDETLKNLCVGLELTQNELRSTLERFGVKQVDALHKRLDPNLHQAMFEIEDASIHAPEFAGFHDDPVDLLSAEDIHLLAEEVAPGSSAAIIVWEHTWAKRLSSAIEDSGGFVVAREYIPESIVAAAFAAVDNA